MGQRGGRVALTRSLVTPAPTAPTVPTAPAAPPEPPIARGGDPKCPDKAYRAAHGKECRCWEYATKRAALAEGCVESGEEAGVVPREAVEISVQRMIEDHIDERPVFERNAVTFWISDARRTPRLERPGLSAPVRRLHTGEPGPPRPVVYATT
jgi:hypothetical protein